MTIGSSIETNVRDRIGATSLITDNAVKTGKEAIDHLTKLEPVQAVTSLTAGVLDGVSRFVGKQAEITRRWLHP